jgi:hypothetical protein
VLHNAFRAPDGSEAVVLVNATERPLHAEMAWHGEVQSLDLDAWEVRLARKDG